MPGFWGTRLRSLDGVSNAPTLAEHPLPCKGTTFRQTLFYLCVWNGNDSRPLFVPRKRLASPFPFIQDIAQACWANHRVMFSTVSP
jgi:hypothetical protein